MSNSDEALIPEFVTLVTDRESVNKDPTKPYVGLEHIPSSGSALIGLSLAADSISSNTIFRAGDILFGKLRPRLRKSIRVDFSGYCSTDVLVFRPTGTGDPGFSAFVLQSDPVFAQAIRTEEGTKMPRCSWRDLRRLKVYSPSPLHQRRISEILLTVDQAIERTEALTAKYQQIKAGLMHDLFTRGVTPDGRLRPPSSEAPHLYKQSPVGLIPVDWSVAGLRESARPGRAHLKTGPFGSSLKIEHWVEQGRPVITIGALGEGQFVESELMHVSEVTAQSLVEYQLISGDVVFSRVADVGRSAVITPSQEGWIMSSNLMRISVDEAKLKPVFLQAQLAYDSRVRTQIRRTVNSGGRDVANGQVLNRLLFPWPQIEEQIRIMERSRVLDSTIAAESERTMKLRNEKQGLMHDLLSGRVRVKIEELAAT